MARATLSCPLQARQLSGAASSSSSSMLGDTRVVRQTGSGLVLVGRASSRRGVVVAQAPQQHHSMLVGSKPETPRWMPNSFLESPSTAPVPAPAWMQEPAPQFARCSWPKQQQAPVMVATKEEEFSLLEGQQLHEEFAAVLRRSRSRELLLETEERQPGPRSAWPRLAVPCQTTEPVLGPRSAWPRTTLEAQERVLGPRCEFPRKSAAMAPPVAGAACAWPQQRGSLAPAVEAEPMRPRCEWPRQESAAGKETGSVAVIGSLKSATGSKVKRATRGWPWGVISVGLEPIFDQDLAEGPRCAWPRLQPQLNVEEPLMQGSVPLSVISAAPCCQWPRKQSALSISQSTPVPALTLAQGPACSWPKSTAVQAVSAITEEPLVLGPRCALKAPEQVLGPRCALKIPEEQVLGPRCALKLPAEEVKIEGPRCAWPKPGSEVEEQLKAQGPRCAWPKPGSELSVSPAQPAEEKTVAPVKVPKKRLGLFPRRGLFTSIPVRAKGAALARVGKVKVAVPQCEDQKIAKPAEKVGSTIWQRRALATSLGLGAINQALLNSQAQAAALEVPAKLQSYRSLDTENKSS